MLCASLSEKPSTKRGTVEAEFRLTGDRPPGQVSSDSEMVQLAAAARQLGFAPAFSFQSTDANIPISMGVPAITIPRGVGDNSHSLTEWTDVERGVSTQVAKAVLLTVVAVVGVR